MYYAFWGFFIVVILGGSLVVLGEVISRATMIIACINRTYIPT